jgi:homoaconitase/3-isopropylmalate dehydratase large subunit
MNPSSIMVRLTAGTSNDAVLRFAADLAKRVKATRVIGIGACANGRWEGSQETC